MRHNAVAFKHASAARLPHRTGMKVGEDLGLRHGQLAENRGAVQRRRERLRVQAEPAGRAKPLERRLWNNARQEYGGMMVCVGVQFDLVQEMGGDRVAHFLVFSVK
jgi:hypothetical protein